MYVIAIFYVSLQLFTFNTNGANILAIFPMPGKSHYVMFEALLKGLAEKGHNVDVASHFPQKNQIPRFNDLNLQGSTPIFLNNMSVQAFTQHDTNYKLLTFMFEYTGEEMCASTFKTDVLKNLRNSTKKYDLLITELFTSDCMMGFAHIFKVPVIQLSSCVDLPWGSSLRIGNPDNPSYIFNYFTTNAGRLTLWERFDNARITLEAKFYYYWFKTDKSYRAFFGDAVPSLDDLIANTSLIIVNSHFSTHQSRPAVPNFIEAGGLHIKPPKPLNEYYSNLVKYDTKTQKGVILLTMGSMILTESFETDKLQGMFDTFAEVPYKVLWKGTREKFPEGLRIPPNIHFEHWMPQMDILCHPNVKVFVSHGGVMGTQETIYCGVPRLGIPLFADQEFNIKHAAKMGAAVRLPYNDISKETFSDAIRKLTEDESYYNKAKSLSELFKDRPMSALNTAIYWVEYVIRHKGAPHLRSYGADMPWYQYFFIDIAVILSTIIASIVYIVYRVVSFVLQQTAKQKKE